MEGEFVECIVTTAKLLAPDKITLFQNVSVSRRTVSDRNQEMGDDIEKTLKAIAQHFESFALALDEITDITNTAQLAIFIRGVTSDFKIQEGFVVTRTHAWNYTWWVFVVTRTHAWNYT